jgi:hypothetical protein
LRKTLGFILFVENKINKKYRWADSGEWAAEEEWRRSEQGRECVSTDRDEELSDVQDSDEEEHYERSGRRFGYNPDNGDPVAEYQAVMGDDWFAW